MFDVVTFGSATWDIFIKPKQLKVIDSKELISGKGLCFNLGSKIDIDEAYVNLGGGGVNTAHTFRRQGLKIAYCGSVGDDVLGRELIQRMKKNKIETKFIELLTDCATNFSVVMNPREQDRTVFVFRDASEKLKTVPFRKLKAKWYYLAPLSGRLSKKTKEIIDFAHKNNTKVAVNLGNSQIRSKGIKSLLKKADILILNQEEAAFLTGVSYGNEKKILKSIREFFDGIFVMTKGKGGVVVLANGDVYRERAIKARVVDKTGAGDAFSSAFVSEIIKTGNIKEAIKLGVNNSAKCIQKRGATNGLI